MSELAYRNGFSFMVGTGFGFGISNSLRLLDESGKLSENIDYHDSYGLGAAVLTEAANNYIEIEADTPVFEALSDDPGFMAGAALGTYMSKKYFELTSTESNLEQLYEENDLDDLWNDIEY